MHLSKRFLVFTALLGLSMAALFYSLALHMYCRLGGWPSSIGDGGFPSLLVAHGHIAFDFFYLIFMTTVFVWPGAFLACLAVPRWRVAALYLGSYALASLLCYGLLLLAPPKFLNWWWD